jgi:4-amino-4-deoxy-L-arabinose transferase-like glycosyltransferase
MSGPQAEPAQATPEPIADKRRRRWPWTTLSVIWVVMVACAGVPIVWVVSPLVVGTVTADHGEPSPGAALLAFVFTFENGPDATGVDRLIVPERRATISRQRRTYLAQMAADTKATGWSATFEIGSSSPDDRVETHGDRASVVDSYRVRWTPPADEQRRMASSGPVVWFNGMSRQWRAEARKDRTGWRLWSVTMPAWCGQDGYSRCNTSLAPSALPSASPSPDDLLSGVRSMLPCAPADPLRQYHDCPSPSTS